MIVLDTSGLLAWLDGSERLHRRVADAMAAVVRARDRVGPSQRLEALMDSRLDRLRELAPLLLRLFVAFVLVYGTQDNVLSTARMHEFRDFLAQNGFPYPLASAYLSVYAQLITGILLALGLFTRLAAAVVTVNFVVALSMVHVGLPFDANIAPLAMLVGGLFFVLYGAPRYSLDAWWRARTTGGRPDVA